MATRSIERVSTCSVTPLVHSNHPTFTRSYEDGFTHALYAEHEHRGPLHDCYLVDRFTLAQRFGLFDTHHERDLFRHIGFTLGEIHGGVLSSNGTLRLEMTTLVLLEDEEITGGYRAGREFFFTDADTEAEWHMSQDRLLLLLRELADEYPCDDKALRTIRFHIGCILGELSGHLFPWTQQEQHTFEQESLRILGYVELLNPLCLAARQFFW